MAGDRKVIETLFHVFITYFNEGGWIMWVIFAVSVVAWTLGVEKLYFLNKFSRYRKRFLRKVGPALSGLGGNDPVGYEPYDQLLGQVRACVVRSSESQSCVLSLREFLISAVPEVERGFSTMSAWISVAPLLGLLGTVSGMIQTFKVITDFGLGNPNLTAQGISIALITTQAGLTVAFPMMIFHNYLVNRSHKIVSNLVKDGEALVKRVSAHTATPGQSPKPQS